jgi:peptidoglycan/LPS O-acetylase OafA/YrhL
MTFATASLKLGPQQTNKGRTSVQPGKSGHFAVLDFYRFLAASGVVILHFGVYDWARQFDLFVDFFFMLSGFVIAHTYGDAVNTVPNILTYLRRRLARIYPLYFLTLMLFAIPALLGMTRISVTPSAILSQLALVNAWPLNAALPFNYPAWSISVEWAMYLLFPLLMLLYRRAGYFGLLTIVLIGFFANAALMGMLPVPSWFLDFNPIRAVPTFVIGILIAMMFRRFSFRNGVWIGFAGFLVSVALMIAHANVYAVLALFSIVILLTAGGEFADRPALFNNRICRVLGDASYSIYMLHFFILSVFIELLWKGHFGGAEVPIVYGVAVGLFIIALSILTFNHFEKPMRDLISGRRQRDILGHDLQDHTLCGRA